MLTLEQRRKLAIAAGMRLETITAIFARRRRCGQRHAVILARAAFRVGVPVRAVDLALNQYSRSPVFAGKPLKV